jgi:hypothetical protein
VFGQSTIFHWDRSRRQFLRHVQAIDSKLCGCEMGGLKVEDVAPHDMTVDRATVRQRETGIPSGSN